MLSCSWFEERIGKLRRSTMTAIGDTVNSLAVVRDRDNVKSFKIDLLAFQENPEDHASIKWDSYITDMASSSPAHPMLLLLALPEGPKSSLPSPARSFMADPP